MCPRCIGRTPHALQHHWALRCPAKYSGVLEGQEKPWREDWGRRGHWWRGKIYPSAHHSWQPASIVACRLASLAEKRPAELVFSYRDRTKIVIICDLNVAEVHKIVIICDLNVVEVHKHAKRTRLMRKRLTSLQEVLVACQAKILSAISSCDISLRWRAFPHQK